MRFLKAISPAAPANPDNLYGDAMNYDLYEASKRLSRINLNLGGLLPQLMSYWCRVVVSERENYNPNPHTHSFFELHLCLRGEGRYTVEGNEIVLHEREYILLPPHTTHHILSQPDGFRKLIWGFKIKEEKVETALIDALSVCEIREADSELLHSIDVILAEANYAEFGYYEVIVGHIASMFSRLVRACTDISQKNVFSKKQSVIIDDIKRYISDNLRLSPTTEEIAAQFSRSAASIDKMCLAECGMTVSALKRQLQFEEIKRLLYDTDLTFDAIADCCGFSDRYTMGKFFRKHEGVPPGEFRKDIKK